MADVNLVLQVGSDSAAAAYAQQANASAQASAASAASASDSATAASGSATQAANSASAAATSATQAGGSATAAGESASAAAQSATAAGTAKTNAQNSASAAATSASNAALSATQASGSATSAASSASAASGSATTASTKAGEAAASASAASTSASNASASATSANNAKTAAETAKTGAETARDQAQAYAGSIASVYSNTATYAVDDYCFHEGQLQRCIVPITTPEAWTAAHWVAVELGDDVSDLKTALNQKVDYISKNEGLIPVETKIDFSVDGKVIDASGNLSNDVNYATTDYIDLTNVTGIYRTGTTTKFMMWRYAFFDESKNLLSVDGETTDYEIVPYNGKQVTWLTLNPNAKYVRICWNKSRPYEYYVVRNVTQVTSYTVLPLIINGENIYTDAIKGKEAKSVVDEVTELTSVNILNPDDFTLKGYYLDFTDGETHITFANGVITGNKIVTGQDVIYIRQTYSTLSINAFIIYCYNDDTYLGYKALSFADMGSSYRLELITGTTEIMVYSNAGANITGDMICLTLRYVEDFVAYDPYYAIKASAMPNKNYYPLYGKVIANFGDSVFGNKRPPTDISTSLASITGATVYNLGFGGCRMSQHSGGWDAFSMYRLAYAIANNDYSVQNAVDVDNVTDMPQYFKETRILLESIDYSKVDILTIAYGTNDFTAGVSLDNPNDEDDCTTFCGALRYSLEQILTAYPQLHIFVCTPTYRFWIDGNNDFLYDSDTHEISGNLLTDFVEAVQTVSKAYHVKSIDNYYDLGIDKYNRSHWFPVNDGTHHNRDGGMLIAQHMANEMF